MMTKECKKIQRFKYSFFPHKNGFSSNNFTYLNFYYCKIFRNFLPKSLEIFHKYVKRLERSFEIVDILLWKETMWDGH